MDAICALRSLSMLGFDNFARSKRIVADYDVISDHNAVSGYNAVDDMTLFPIMT